MRVMERDLDASTVMVRVTAIVELFCLLHYPIISRSRVPIQLGCTSLQAGPVRKRLGVMMKAQKINVVVRCGVVRARGDTTARHEVLSMLSAPY
jgi:hypothetical protein